MTQRPAATSGAAITHRRAALPGGAGLVAACAAAAIVISEAAIFRLVVGVSGVLPLPERLVSVLVATALLLTALLALPRSNAVAWAAAAAAAAIGTVEAVSVVRSLDAIATGTPWRDLVALAGLALTLGATVAAAYAGRHWRAGSRLARGAAIVVGAGLVATAAASLSAFVAANQAGAQPAVPGELTPLRLAARIGLVTIAGGFLVGLGADMGAPTRRAFERWRADAAKPADRRLWRFIELLADELAPGRAKDRQQAVDAERARLAADIHALVLPELRRAAATAEAAGLPADVQVDLLRALEDVEQLMHERQSIVLEQFGLVAALEWLAERTEERSRLRVELDLDGALPDRPAAFKPDVARAAFRIALLALDNIVRHAGATTATISLSGGANELRLLVVDDGRAADPSRPDGRGIADMRSAASGSHGAIEIRFDPGTRVEAIWPAAL